MPLGKAFAELRVALDELAGAVRQLRVHIDDAPQRPALADRFRDGADDIEGWVAEAIATADEALGRGPGMRDPEAAMLALTSVHERALLVGQRLGGLLTLDRAEELLRFDEERGGGWARGLGEALERCREQLDGPRRWSPAERSTGVRRALLDCWQELSERTATGSVSVHATSIGKQVSRPAETTSRIGSGVDEGRAGDPASSPRKR